MMECDRKEQSRVHRDRDVIKNRGRVHDRMDKDLHLMSEGTEKSL